MSSSRWLSMILAVGKLPWRILGEPCAAVATVASCEVEAGVSYYTPGANVTEIADQLVPLSGVITPEACGSMCMFYHGCVLWTHAKGSNPLCLLYTRDSPAPTLDPQVLVGHQLLSDNAVSGQPCTAVCQDHDLDAATFFAAQEISIASCAMMVALYESLCWTTPSNGFNYLRAACPLSCGSCVLPPAGIASAGGAESKLLVPSVARALVANAAAPCNILEDHLYSGTLLYGADAASAEACAAICAGDSRCHGFTYIKVPQTNLPCRVLANLTESTTGDGYNVCCDSGLPCSVACADYNGDLDRALGVTRGCPGLFLQMHSLWLQGSLPNPVPCDDHLTSQDAINGVTVKSYCPLSCSVWSAVAQMTSTSTSTSAITVAASAVVGSSIPIGTLAPSSTSTNESVGSDFVTSAGVRGKLSTRVVSPVTLSVCFMSVTAIHRLE